MTIERYNYFAEKIEREHSALLKSTRSELAKSKSKKRDFAIVNSFYTVLMDKDFENYEEIFTDCNAMLPMPESVGKQLALRLFNFKHLNPLYDLGIYEGFY